MKGDSPSRRDPTPTAARAQGLPPGDEGHPAVAGAPGLLDAAGSPDVYLQASPTALPDGGKLAEFLDRALTGRALFTPPRPADRSAELP